MKRLLAIIVILFTIWTATAQVEHSIILEQNTFHVVQSDALTGVNIDPISKDRSRNACARVKIKFKNMNRAQIDALDVKFRSNTDKVRQEVAMYYDNVLILEMTAKPNTRFYVQSPDFGQSNEVTFNLEGDKEYEMEAHLNQTYSIVVNSNFEGAAVYIDDQYKGITNNNYQLTVKDITPGNHTLKVVYGGAHPEQKINVHQSSISFRQNLDISATMPQYVVFQLTPADAVLEIDGSIHAGSAANGGTVVMRLKSGSYKYTVTAPNYVPINDEIVVRDKKIVRPIELKPAFGFLQISGENLTDAYIRIDGNYVGKMPIEQQKLKAGEHSVKIMKEHYKPYETTVTIIASEIKSLTPELEKGFAKVTLNAATSETEIWLNEKYVGKGSFTTELDKGYHVVEGRKAGHSSRPHGFEIEDSDLNSGLKTISIPAATPMYGLLDVSSDPSIAKIIIDGQDTGHKTPDVIDSLLVGKHMLTISKPGYKPHTQPIEITKDHSTELAVPLIPDGESLIPTPVITKTTKREIKNREPKIREPRKLKVLNAQEQKTPRQSKPINLQPAAPVKVKNGYQSIVDLGYSMHAISGSVVNHIGLNYVGGLRVNKMFVGLGVGAEFSFDGIDNDSSLNNAYKNFISNGSDGTAMASGVFSVPLYLHMRAYMGSSNRVFMALSAGGKLFGSNSFTYIKQKFKYNTNGMFVDLGAGLQLNKFFISAGVTTQTLPCAEFVSENQIDLKSKFGIGAKVSMGFTF